MSVKDLLRSTYHFMWKKNCICKNWNPAKMTAAWRGGEHTRGSIGYLCVFQMSLCGSIICATLLLTKLQHVLVESGGECFGS